MSSPPPSPDASPSARYAGFWDRIADGYAKKPIANPEAYQRKLELTKPRLSPDQVLLDIGCGTGSLALELAPLVSQVHAIDLSEQMVRIASGKAEAAAIDNVRFHHTSVEAVSEFGPASFDVITAFNILHLVDDLDATLVKLFAMLEPGGTFVSSTVCLREGWMPYGLVLPVMRWLGKAPHVLLLRAADVLDSMREVGFVDVRREEVGSGQTTLFVLARKPG